MWKKEEKSKDKRVDWKTEEEIFRRAIHACRWVCKVNGKYVDLVRREGWWRWKWRRGCIWRKGWKFRKGSFGVRGWRVRNSVLTDQLARKDMAYISEKEEFIYAKRKPKNTEWEREMRKRRVSDGDVFVFACEWCVSVRVCAVLAISTVNDLVIRFLFFI